MTAAHSGFILAAYGAAIVVIGGAALAIWLDHRRLKRELARLGADRDAG